MEVVEHVDNPATFLRSCAELVKVRPPLPSTHASWLIQTCLFLIARWTSVLVDHRAHAARVPPHDRSGGEASTRRGAWHTYLLQIYQP